MVHPLYEEVDVESRAWLREVVQQVIGDSKFNLEASLNKCDSGEWLSGLDFPFLDEMLVIGLLIALMTPGLSRGESP